MKVGSHSVISINNALWTLIDPVNGIVERLGVQTRLIFKTRNSGKMVTTDLQTGRISSKPFVSR